MSLLSFFKIKNNKTEVIEEALLEANVCPNCWGHSEYSAEFDAYVSSSDEDIHQKDRKGQKAFIMKFVEDRITGITLTRKLGTLTCPSCSKSYSR